MDAVSYATRRSSYLACLGSEQIRDLDTLGQHEFDILAHLCHHRRSLPIYRKGLWHCFDCDFYSVDISEVSRHILTIHQACPLDEDDDYVVN